MIEDFYRFFDVEEMFFIICLKNLVHETKLFLYMERELHFNESYGINKIEEEIE